MCEARNSTACVDEICCVGREIYSVRLEGGFSAAQRRSKISAGVSVGIGGHSEQRGDEQFEISDARSVSEVCEAIRGGGLQPLMSEYIYV